MGKSSTETVREIENLRGRIEDNFRQLEERVPQAGIWMKRAAGVLATGVGLLVLRSVWKGIRSRKKGGELDEDSWVLVRVGDLEKLSEDRPVAVVMEEE
jgi:hypothetical protein